MSVSGVVSIMDKVDAWMSPLTGAVDAMLRPIVEPIAQLADPITGDSETVYDAASNWRSLSRSMAELADDLSSIARATEEYWIGAGGDAYRARVVDAVCEIREISNGLEETSTQLEDAARQIAVAEELVITIITELIEMLLVTIATAVALSWITAGASALAGSAAAAAEAAVAGSRIASVIAKVAAALNKVATFLKVLQQAKWATDKGLVALRFLVKAAAVKPIVKSLTGLTADPVGEGVETIIDGAVAIGADKIDDALGPLPEPLQFVEEIIDAVDEMIPKAPWQN